MFDDGKLAKALAYEEKSGLVLSFDGGQVTAIGRDWMALFPQDLLRSHYRQTLGHLVEVLGYVPEVETLEIYKAKGEYIVERPLPEVVASQAADYLEVPLCKVKYTDLRRYGKMLFQAQRGRIYACSMRGPDLGSKSAVVLTGADTLRWCDENSGEELYRRAEHPREDSHTEAELDAWDHLEAFAWCQWDEPDAGGQIEGQEVMEDGQT